MNQVIARASSELMRLATLVGLLVTMTIVLMLASTRALAAGVTLAWDPVQSPALAGYMLYYGPAQGNYPTKVDVGSATSYTMSNLVEGTTYHFVVTAYDGTRTESGFSNDVAATVPYTAPVANFSASTTSGIAPLAMNFSNTSTGNVTSYVWAFGDGTSSTVQSPAHVYSAAGTYTVSLSASGPGGTNTLTKPGYITVTSAPAAPPVAAFSASPTSGAAPLTVDFTSSSTGNVSSYAWTFGDGTTSTTQNPSHAYSSAGVYSVSLTVTGPDGTNSLTKSGYVTVSAPTSTAPAAAFSASPTSGVASLTVNFTSKSTGSISSYAWTFGDGATSTAQNPSHVYSAPGTYTVSHTVSGPGGSDTKTAANYITVSSTTTGTCPCSIWSSSSVPTVADDPDTSPVELGVKFKSDRSGYITGIRFYKSLANTGTHVGSLWQSNGKRLAQATFTNETSSGWQTVRFAKPVRISAGTVYVASYHTNAGHYANDDGYFASAGVDNGPLHAVRDGASGSNGVYTYSAHPTFPRTGYKATNYWVDVIFELKW